ncbi:hypothetical protein AHAS_Ahas05G0058600 [Arachis hypogaea]
MAVAITPQILEGEEEKIQYKALIRRCPEGMFSEWVELQNVYEGLSMKSRKALDYSLGGSLQMMKAAQQAHNLKTWLPIMNISTPLKDKQLPREAYLSLKMLIQYLLKTRSCTSNFNNE